MISVTNIIFPSIMIIILINPGIAPVQNPYPYFTDEVTETLKVNCLPKAMQQLGEYHHLNLIYLLPWQWNNYASFQRRKVIYCLYHRRLVLMNNRAERSHIIGFKITESTLCQQNLLLYFLGCNYFRIIKLHIYTLNKLSSHPCR